MTWKHILFSFRGRLNRKPYWIATITISLGYAAALFVFLSVGHIISQNSAANEPQALVLFGAVLLMVISGFVTYFIATIYAKRLHDRNKSALWLLFIVVGGGLFEFATLFGVATVGTDAEPSTLGNALIAIGGLISLWFFIELGFFKGTQGPNRFGDDPLGAKAADAGL